MILTVVLDIILHTKITINLIVKLPISGYNTQLKEISNLSYPFQKYYRPPSISKIPPHLQKRN